MLFRRRSHTDKRIAALEAALDKCERRLDRLDDQPMTIEEWYARECTRWYRERRMSNGFPLPALPLSYYIDEGLVPEDVLR